MDDARHLSIHLRIENRLFERLMKIQPFDSFNLEVIAHRGDDIRFVLEYVSAPGINPMLPEDRRDFTLASGAFSL
jgi:hypothetical protein